MEQSIDIVIRIFHWCLVLLLTCLFVSSTTVDNAEFHLFFGHLISALVVARIAWGFLKKGEQDSWNKYLHKPEQLFRYIAKLLRKETGAAMQLHNPAGSYMSLVMMILLFLSVLTGLMMEAVFEFDGIAMVVMSHTNTETAYLIENIHTYVSYSILGLSVIHIAGVLYSSRLYGVNLPLAIITGRIKYFGNKHE